MKKIAIVLGYELKSDSSMDPILIKRLDLALDLLKEEDIDKIIVTGGKTGKDHNVSEAERMFEYLVTHGVDPEMIIIEDHSGSTFGNAKYSVPIAKSLNANTIIIVTTFEHFTNYDYNPLKIFSEFINDDNIHLMIYTNTIPKL